LVNGPYDRARKGDVGDMKKQNNNKKSIVRESLENVYEFGRDTAKQAGIEIVNTINPFSELFTNPTSEERKKGNNNFTDIDFDKLNNSYKQHDSPELDQIRQQLGVGESNDPNEKKMHLDYHRRVKREEEEVYLKKEQEEEEKERDEALAEQEKQQAEEEQAKQQGAASPKGKVRRSIMGSKGSQKSSSELPPEFQPGAGKQ